MAWDENKYRSKLNKVFAEHKKLRRWLVVLGFLWVANAALLIWIVGEGFGIF